MATPTLRPVQYAGIGAAAIAIAAGAALLAAGGSTSTSSTSLPKAWAAAAATWDTSQGDPARKVLGCPIKSIAAPKEAHARLAHHSSSDGRWTTTWQVATYKTPELAKNAVARYTMPSACEASNGFPVTSTDMTPAPGNPDMLLRTMSTSTPQQPQNTTTISVTKVSVKGPQVLSTTVLTVTTARDRSKLNVEATNLALTSHESPTPAP